MISLPVGKISGDQLNNLFEKAVNDHIDFYYKFLSEYDHIQLYSNWQNLIRSIDEMINIPFVLNISDREKYLELNINILQSNYQPTHLQYVIKMLENKFGKKISNRFVELTIMCSTLCEIYKSHGILEIYNNGLELSKISDCISFLQSKRAYYITTLNLIPKVAKGSKSFTYKDTINFIHYSMDSCLTAITNGYFNLLTNSCLSDYEMTSDGHSAKGNFDYNHLEGFFLEPERLSLLDQMELRPDIVVAKEMIPLPSKQIFSFGEIANTMNLFEGAFDKYDIADKEIFSELNKFLCEIGIYLHDDYHIQIDETIFEKIQQKFRSLSLHSTSTDYFDNLNGFYPFQYINETYFSTVVLLNKFIYQSLSKCLLNNKSFQINSGFVFEDKAKEILSEKGYKYTGITRINRKEFDLITIKNNKVYNFQCKNNIFDVANVTISYKKNAQHNNRLCESFEKALIKEENREALIRTKTGIEDVSHFVISRFPVITRNVRIINFNNLQSWELSS